MQIIQDDQWAKLMEICEFAAANSRFYRRKIKPPRTQEEFRSLSILTSEDIRQNVDPRGYGDLLTASVAGSVLLSTSSSTGPKKFIFREYKEHHRVSKQLSDALSLAGMVSEDRIANMFPPGNLAGAWLGMQEAIERIGATSLPIGCSLNLEKQKTLMQYLQPTGFVGTPTSLIQIVDMGISSLQKVICGGEGMNQRMRENLERGTRIPISLVYGSVECGIIGIQCNELRGSSQYHTFENDMLLEILDPSTGCPAQEGEIIVTHFHRRLQPMIRYRLGDLGQWHDSPCPCGRTGTRIELKGRIGDTMTIVNGLQIRYESIESALSKLGKFSGRFQLRVRRVESNDVLNIIVEADDLSSQTVTNAVLRKLPELQSQHQRGLVITTIVPRGGILIEGDKTLRIADERLKIQT